jgi:hypothetical protein
MNSYDETADYDRDGQEAALRLIIGRCPRLASQAAYAMRVTGDAARQARLDRLIPQALADAAAWTAEERQQLAEAMWAARDGSAEAPARRTETMRFRVTPDEKAQIEANAAQHGQDPSEFMRSRALA